MPRKTFELLKALVAVGSESVFMVTVFDALWPDLDGAFGAALSSIQPRPLALCRDGCTKPALNGSSRLLRTAG